MKIQKKLFTAYTFCAVAISGTIPMTHAALILHYDFESDTTASGGVHDQSGSSNDGSTFTDGGGTAGFSSDTPFISSTQSLALFGSQGTGSANEARVIADTPAYTGLAGSGDRTFAAWIKTSGTNDQFIFAYGTNSTSDKFILRLDQMVDGVLGDLRLRFETSGSFLNGTVAVSDGEWHHVAVVIDQSETNNALLYVDGVLDVSGSVGVTTILDGNVALGGSSTGSGDTGQRNFTGNMDDVMFYDEELDSTQIAVLAAVPEPSSAALLGLGGFALILRRRK